jgi:hypothetical protein
VEKNLEETEGVEAARELKETSGSRSSQSKSRSILEVAPGVGPEIAVAAAREATRVVRSTTVLTPRTTPRKTTSPKVDRLQSTPPRCLLIHVFHHWDL